MLLTLPANYARLAALAGDPARFCTDCIMVHNDGARYTVEVTDGRHFARVTGESPSPSAPGRTLIPVVAWRAAFKPGKPVTITPTLLLTGDTAIPYTQPDWRWPYTGTLVPTGAGDPVASKVDNARMRDIMAVACNFGETSYLSWHTSQHGHCVLITCGDFTGLLMGVH